MYFWGNNLVVARYRRVAGKDDQNSSGLWLSQNTRTCQLSGFQHSSNYTLLPTPSHCTAQMYARVGSILTLLTTVSHSPLTLGSSDLL
jgi:hypothetical protein